MKKTLKEKGFALQDKSCTTINKLFHIASMSRNNDLEELLEDFELEDFQKIIPSVTKQAVESYEDNLAELFFDKDKYGFLAECYFNVPKNFHFNDEGAFRSCSNSCESYIFYSYAESMEDLLDVIMNTNNEMWHKEADIARKEQGIVIKSDNQ